TGSTFTTPTTTMNNPHSDCAGVLIGGDYYLFGDINEMTATSDQSVLDSMLALGNFGASASGVLPAPRWSRSLVRTGDTLYPLTAVTSTSMPNPDPTILSTAVSQVNGVEQLAASFGTLTTPTVNTARRAPIGVVLGNYAYVMDGTGLAGGSLTDLNSIEQAPL